MTNLIPAAQAVAHNVAGSVYLWALIIACASVIAATLATEHFARKREPRNTYLDPWRDREPGELPEVER